jgi:hypothetical protein
LDGQGRPGLLVALPTRLLELWEKTCHFVAYNYPFCVKLLYY